MNGMAPRCKYHRFPVLRETARVWDRYFTFKIVMQVLRLPVRPRQAGGASAGPRSRLRRRHVRRRALPLRRPQRRDPRPAGHVPRRRRRSARRAPTLRGISAKVSPPFLKENKRYLWRNGLSVAFKR